MALRVAVSGGVPSVVLNRKKSDRGVPLPQRLLRVQACYSQEAPHKQEPSCISSNVLLEEDANAQRKHDSNSSKHATDATSSSSDGGRRHQGMSPEARMRLAASMRAKWQQAEFRSRVCGALRGRTAWNKGVSMTPEARARSSVTKTGTRSSEETRQRQSAAHKGKEIKPTTRQLIADANQRSWQRRGFKEWWLQRRYPHLTDTIDILHITGIPTSPPSTSSRGRRSLFTLHIQQRAQALSGAETGAQRTQPAHYHKDTQQQPQKVHHVVSPLRRQQSAGVDHVGLCVGDDERATEWERISELGGDIRARSERFQREYGYAPSIADLRRYGGEETTNLLKEYFALRARRRRRLWESRVDSADSTPLASASSMTISEPRLLMTDVYATEEDEASV